jgi:PAS domain S-box-containing protein
MLKSPVDLEILLRAIDETSDVILIFRVEPDPQGLTLLYMNDAFTRQTGYVREEAIGLSLDTFRQAMPDDDGMREIRVAIAEGRAGEAELVSYRRDGSSYWNQLTIHPIVESGRITHWITVGRDISDDVASTSVLAEKHDRLLALVRAARRIFTAFDAQRLVETVKDVGRELLGASPAVLGANAAGNAVEVNELGRLEPVFPREADPLVARAIVERRRAVDESQRHAVVYAGQFGDQHYVLELRVPAGRRLRSADLFVLDLIAEYFAVAARNVALYQELESRRSSVLELSQTKSDLIAMLAHDFRGPLTSIVGYSDLVGEVGGLNDEQRDFIESIKRSALQLSELATDTLTLSRLERNEVALQLGDVDLAELLHTIVEQFADRREVTLDVQGDAHVFGDDERLRQVFTNLIDNAVKYTPNGAPPLVTVAPGPDNVTVKVSDRGIGIPSGELTAIFDRFSRASNARRLRVSGTGFGLFLSKQLVALHGGTIAVESREGEGSTFTVTLPRRTARTSTPRMIVVLDDERSDSFLAYGLRDGGYRVRTAASIDDVIAIADSEKVDALVVAVDDLPSDRAARVRAFGRERNIPIVATEGGAAARLGAIATVPKPVLAGDVMAILERER